jgi:hypothetical protein
MVKRSLILAAMMLCFNQCIIAAPPARADAICMYPLVGMGINVGGITGGFCDGPTEINGSHFHCQAGGVGLGLSGSAGGGVFGAGASGQGAGGVSCNWRCPDGVDAPAPNPPGAWQHYLVPMTTTNYCKDHMTPNGFWSAPVLPTEGIPPVNEQPPQPGEVPPPQPVPPPLPTMAPGQPPPIAPTPSAPVPGEPNALQPAPGEPNP